MAAPLPRVRLRQRRGRELLPEVRRVHRRAASARGGESVDGDLPRRRDRRADPGRRSSDVVAQRGRGAGHPRRRRPRRRELPARRRAHDDRPAPGLRRLPRRRDGLARPRAARPPRRRAPPRRPRLAQRHLRQPPAHRVAPARRRRRAAGRQVQAHVPLSADGRPGRPSRSPPRSHRREPPAREGDDDRRGLQGAGAGVPRHLDLEDPLPRGPEAARAAAHARRLPALHAGRRRAAAHDPAPAARRVPAAAGHPPGARRPGRARRRRRAAPAPRAGRPARPRRRAGASASRAARRAVLARGRARGDARRAARWSPSSRSTASSRASMRAGAKYYDETEREIVRAVTELARYGVGGRNLRAFRTSRRPRGRAAAADPGPGAALAQRRAPQGGASRRWRTSPRSRRTSSTCC